MSPDRIDHDVVAVDELEQTRRQFWMPPLVAALIVIGGPIAYVLVWVLYMALTGQGLD